MKSPTATDPSVQLQLTWDPPAHGENNQYSTKVQTCYSNDKVHVVIVNQSDTLTGMGGSRDQLTRLRLFSVK